MQTHTYSTDDVESIVETPQLAPEGFQINDEQSFAWAMKRRFELESRVTMGKQLVENSKVVLSRAESDLKAFDYRFETELAHYAKATATDGRKSLVCAYGKIAWRETKPKWKVICEPDAIQWAKDNGYDDAIKVTEKFLVSAVPANEELKAPGLEYVPAGESVTISGTA